MTEPAIRRNAASNGDGWHTVNLGGTHETIGERAHDGLLVRRRKVGPPGRGALFTEVAHHVEQRGFDPCIREVEPWPATPEANGKVERRRVAVAGERLEAGAAGVRDAEQSRPLVDGLTGGVIKRLAQQLRSRVILDEVDAGVATGCRECNKRGIEREGLKPYRRDMAV